MNPDNKSAYTITIILNLPKSGKSTHLKVTLLPTDELMVEGNNTYKALQDCTLGELLQFAENLENEIWSHHTSSTLLDLVIEGAATVSFIDENADLDQPIPNELWLEHVIVLPQGTKVDMGESVLLATEPVSAGDEDQESKITTRPPLEMPDDVDDTPSKEEAGDFDKQIVFEDQVYDVGSESTAIKTKDDEFNVTVAESEPVHKELEAEPIDSLAEPIVKPTEHIPRILGRRRPLFHQTWTAVDILMNEPAFRNAQAHAISNPDREVAGVLIGPPPEKQPDGRYVVHISDTIIAKHTRMHGASVTYTPESWRYIHDKLTEMYPDDDAVIVGWYHTHPGFGIFLSGMDQFIHQNFFTQCWHIAMVLDPLAHQSGFFCWNRQQTEVNKYDFPWPKWATGSW